MHLMNPSFGGALPRRVFQRPLAVIQPPFCIAQLQPTLSCALLHRGSCALAVIGTTARVNELNAITPSARSDKTIALMMPLSGLAEMCRVLAQISGEAVNRRTQQRVRAG